MLKQRVITAIVLLAVFLAAAAVGRIFLDAVFAMLIGAATFEWLRLAQPPPLLALCIAGALAAALFASEVTTSWSPGVGLTLLALAAAAWLTIALVILRGARRGAKLPHLLSTGLAILLLSAAWLALMRLLDVGFVLLLSVLAIVWIADIAAYFAGRRWGRRKLAPAISPGKTWAGVGGAVAGVLAAAVLSALLWPELKLFSTLMLQRLGTAAALAILAALVALSIVGDLFESLLKRQVDAKDSGRLLPGHGGVLDRVDALIAVLPAAALLEVWMRG